MSDRQIQYIPYVRPYDHLSFVVRALTPSRSHNFSLRRSTRRNNASLGYVIRIPYRVGLPSEQLVFFLFNREDWKFNLTDPLHSFSRRALHHRLKLQFDELELASNQILFGEYKPEPLPLYTKVLIIKGIHIAQAGIVVNNATRQLRILTEEHNVISLSQDHTYIIDPEDTLPFGTPVRPEFLFN